MALWQLCHEVLGVIHPDHLPPMTSRQLCEVFAYYVAKDLPNELGTQTTDEMRQVLHRALGR